jgi:hypothetical protein
MSERPAIAYPRFFNPQELGKSLKEVATDFVANTHKNIISRWFHSAKDADLFIWLDSNQNIIKQQLSFYGQVVEWNVVEGVKTGLIVETEVQTKMNSSEVVRFDTKPQKGPVEQALALLDHITALKDGERQALVVNFKSEGGTTMPPEMFLERFGSYLPQEASLPPLKPSWLRRLFSRFWRR